MRILARSVLLSKSAAVMLVASSNALKASSVGAKTVKGPLPLSVSVRSALSIAARSVVKLPSAFATSMIVPSSAVASTVAVISAVASIVISSVGATIVMVISSVGAIVASAVETII